ncbi:MAG TPA: TIM barrel protein, partial [Nitrososphaerales archaeon]|nr:TIM barrel protein [Nitrososphaerales archaeon]
MKPEPMVGLHVSAAGSPELAFERAKEIGANTFQIFTRNPNQWRFKPIPEETVAAFRQKRAESGFRRIVDHMPYLPNLASPEKSTMKISRFTLVEELRRCDALGID